MSDTTEAARTRLADRRKAFEAWMKERHQFLGDLLVRDAYFRDCYSDRATEEAWQAWQAATKAAEAMERERWRNLLEARAAGCERAAENFDDPKFDAMARVLMSVREDGSGA